MACGAATPTPFPTRAAATATPSVGGPTATPRVVQGPGGRSYKQWAQPPQLTINTASKYSAVFKTSKGDFTVELYAAETPKTVNNFVFLARDGFYNGVIFHRIIKGFMIQSGDPKGDGTGGPGYRFADEPVTKPYSPGALAMANAGPNTNGSQFFIMHGPDVQLPPNYVIFGKVVKGMETIESIASTPVKANAFGEVSTPTETVTIQSVEISETPD
ncbi:MAG: peptidylprolyl isomerase [SAR202 cluster bacterium]|nr:peptidylprolyl isomerase [SAR202 cluster bacterium]